MPSKEGLKDVAWPGLVASAFATIVSRAATYPADTLKARLQVQGALKCDVKYRNTLHAFRQVAAAEGFLGFYRGFLPVLGGVLPATMVYFYVYESAKKLIGGRYGALGDFGVGAAAQLSAGFVFTPVDVIKERLQVQSMIRREQTSAFQAVQSLLQHEGPKGLLRGYWITNSVWIPWTSIYIAIYEASKRQMARKLRRDEPEKLPGWAFASCSGFAAATAAAVTHPLDVVKTRLQLAKESSKRIFGMILDDKAKLTEGIGVLTANPAAHNRTAIAIAGDMLSHEGIVAFSHGGLARMLQIAPGAAISWVLYEEIKQKLQAIV